jgi:hypothetical protein
MPGLDGIEQQQDQQRARHHGIDDLRAKHDRPAVGPVGNQSSE